MRNRRTRRSREAALLLWGCVGLFAARVVGQFEVLMRAPAWLPPMDAWYSGLLPYHLLLPAQIALLMLMAVVAWNRRVRTGRVALARPRLARTLRACALFYFGIMALRLAVDVGSNGGDYWRAGAIPVAFHWVLALFMRVSAREPDPESLRIPAGDQHQHDEADDIPHGDVPALSQPLAYGFGLREQVGHRDAG
jgi:hypothetical protein